MSLFSRFDRHSILVGKMADAVGADIVGAAVKGAVPETALRSAIYGCMGCKETEACEHWLEDHPDGAEAAPEYCRNKRMLDRISAA